ncbi:TPA: hypothetical protein PC521_005215 [Klebsiella michiganensis]|nr:hypothetical protein [Klebsiella michiganensis]
MSDDQDVVTLTVGDKKIEGWDSVRVTRSVERFPSDFSLGLLDYYPGTHEQQLVVEGAPCKVSFGEDPVITGYVDSWEPAITRARLTLMPPEAFAVQPYAFYQQIAGFSQ